MYCEEFTGTGDYDKERQEMEMELTDIKELYRNREAYLDKEVTVGGWVRSIRDSKTFGFIVVNDGTFFETLQIVYKIGRAHV